MGELDRSRLATAQFLRALAHDPPLQRAAQALCDERVPEADFLLREYLRQQPDHPLALRLRAEAAFWRQKDADAIALLGRCLALGEFPGARFARALSSYRAGHAVAAQHDLEQALLGEPQNPAYRALLASVLSKTSEIERTVALYDGLTREYPQQPKLWMAFGHVLKASGRQTESIAAYRRSIELEPRLGEAWWSLANLKTVKFDAADIAAMQAQLQRSDLANEDRLHFEFALGKALEDARRYAESLILPNARIIDARRHPLASCFSNFKQHFAMGQLFSYGLENIGRFYRDYVELMAHYDAVLPGRVHRVIYERMVDDTENEVRRLLEYCGLPFEDRCLRFYENDRIVRTASSEQVRRPIYKEGVDHWRHYEPWLDPLKVALGPVLEAYPNVPDFKP
ncbi:MAG: sulfotransferase family protein [Gammaproteobacteria bacterium]|nr:sulfotransferase family protein [Gammaproteobacteria bacterium]